MKNTAIALALLLAFGLFAGPAHASEPSLFDALPSGEDTTPSAGEGISLDGQEVRAVPPILQLTVERPTRTAQAREALAANADTVGWLTVPDTAIDFPVLQSGDNQHYLRRDFDGNLSYNGSLFADYRCAVGATRGALSNNTVIYGQSSGTSPDDEMFGQLNAFRDYGFALLHPYLFFSTTGEDMVWEIFAVSVVTVDLPYNMPHDDLDAWWEIVTRVRGASMHDYAVALSPQDKVLTLSTADYSVSSQYPNDYRLVVMARLVEDGADLHYTANLADIPGISVISVG